MVSKAQITEWSQTAFHKETVLQKSPHWLPAYPNIHIGLFPYFFCSLSQRAKSKVMPDKRTKAQKINLIEILLQSLEVEANLEKSDSWLDTI